MMSKSKGSRYERELVNALDAAGYAALRLPSSGSSTDRDLPDVLALTPDETIYDDREKWNDYRMLVDAWAIELKMTSGTTAYADDEEVHALCDFANQAGARPFLGARFSQDRTVYLVRPGDCRKTETKYGVPQSDARDRATFTVDAAVGVVGGPV